MFEPHTLKSIKFVVMLLVVLCAAGGYGCGQNKLTADEARAIAKEATV